MSVETDIAEIKTMLARMQIQLNNPMLTNKVCSLKDLLIAFNVKRRETVIKRIQQLGIPTVKSKQLQVMESSLREAGVI